MGGMFTILKVRENLKGYADPGWYDMPKGTLATTAVASDMHRDGIDPKRAPPVEDDPAA
jgi:hypothetical protein